MRHLKYQADQEVICEFMVTVVYLNLTAGEVALICPSSTNEEDLVPIHH